MKSAAENEELAHLFHKQLVAMCAHAMRNHKKNQRTMEPRLVQALQTMLRFNSFNKLLQFEMGLTTNFDDIALTGAHELCLDFEGENYPGKEGRKLHALGYKVLGPCLRFSLDTDIDEVMHTADETLLAEAQERMYKSDTQHTWNHLMETERELRTLIYNLTN